MMMRVKRGPQSWAYFYLILAITISIESSVIQMIKPLEYPRNIAVFLGCAAITGYLILANGWVQNKLIAVKNFYEEKER